MGAAAVGLATGVGVLAFSHLHRGSSRAGSVRSVLVSARLHVSVGGDSRSRLLLLGFQRLALRYAAGCYWLLFALAHSLLYVGIIPQPIQPCTATGPSCSGDGMTIFGGLPLPFLSLAIFVAIIILLLLVRRRIHS